MREASSGVVTGEATLSVGLRTCITPIGLRRTATNAHAIIMPRPPPARLAPRAVAHDVIRQTHQQPEERGHRNWKNLRGGSLGTSARGLGGGRRPSFRHLANGSTRVISRFSVWVQKHFHRQGGDGLLPLPTTAPPASAVPDSWQTPTPAPTCSPWRDGLALLQRLGLAWHAFHKRRRRQPPPRGFAIVLQPARRSAFSPAFLVSAVWASGVRLRQLGSTFSPIQRKNSSALNNASTRIWYGSM